MFGNNSDREWQKFGKKNPYYWVTTFRKYRDENLSEEKHREFFNEGGGYVKNILNVYRGRKWSYPMMQLNVYNLNRIIDILIAGGCRQFYFRYTKVSRYNGVIIIAQKQVKETAGFIDLGCVP